MSSEKAIVNLKNRFDPIYASNEKLREAVWDLICIAEMQEKRIKQLEDDLGIATAVYG